jgi:hypothetical protein
MAKIELALCLLWVAAAAGLNFSSDDGQLERKHRELIIITESRCTQGEVFGEVFGPGVSLF